MYTELTYEELMKILGISMKTAYNKIKGYSEYTACELVLLKKYLNISFDTLYVQINERRIVNKYDI